MHGSSNLEARRGFLTVKSGGNGSSGLFLWYLNPRDVGFPSLVGGIGFGLLEGMGIQGSNYTDVVKVEMIKKDENIFVSEGGYQ